VARLEVIQAPLAINVLIGLCYGLSLNSLVNSERRFPLHELSLNLADFSYSLYLLHFPLVLLLLSVMYTYGGFGLKMSPSGVSVLVFCATCLLAITGSWLTAGFTEARTPWLRDRMYAWTGVPMRTAKLA
jgi:peptidoglycan/LPS O-acetylase OafA/YrhL